MEGKPDCTRAVDHVTRALPSADSTCSANPMQAQTDDRIPIKQNQPPTPYIEVARSKDAAIFYFHPTSHREPKVSPRSSGQLHLLLSFPSSVPVVFSSLPTSSPTRAPVASTTGVGRPSAAIIVAHIRIIPRIAILVIILIHLLLAIGMVIMIGD